MSLVSTAVAESCLALREQFESAKPFRHVCIDRFFNQEFAENLLAEFPQFNPQLAINEHGEVGGKSVHTDIQSLGPSYQNLYEFIASDEFLEMVSNITGIPSLKHDPQMYGGGTHENLHGQELDPHVDFNYNQNRDLHRRLNILVYLNHEWRGEWGGAIELHSNPRNPDTNQIIEYNCVFNRCVIFETNESSWHGFRKITLPEEKRHLSRKCVSIYLYTKDRPENEIAPEHATFYVQRPLPAHLVAGYSLTSEDVSELHSLLARRDGWIAYYQHLELEKQREIMRLGKAKREITESLERQVKQQNEEVELRGQVLERKRQQLSDEQKKVQQLELKIAELELRSKDLSAKL